MSVALVYPKRVVLAVKANKETVEVQAHPRFTVLDDDELRGMFAYLRALELEDLPASWAEPYIPQPLDPELESKVNF